jgi:hypothetical protein
MSDFCVVNVSFRERYLPYQRRLADGLAKFAPGVDRMFWTDELPEGAPPHQDLPYAFKLYAIEKAREAGYRKILWLDAGVDVRSPIDPILKLVEERAVLLVADDDALALHCSDQTLQHFMVDRKWADGVKLTGGGIIGLDLRSYRGAAFYFDWWDAYKAGLYKYDRWDESIFGCLAPKYSIELLTYGGVWDWKAERAHKGTVLVTGYEH